MPIFPYNPAAMIPVISDNAFPAQKSMVLGEIHYFKILLLTH